MRISFLSYVFWREITVVADGETKVLTPENDAIAVIRMSIDNLATESISIPPTDAFEIVARDWEEFAPREKIAGVPVSSIRTPQDRTEMHPGDAMVKRPSETIVPDQDGLDYYLLYDCGLPPATDYLLKYSDPDSESKPAYLLVGI